MKKKQHITAFYLETLLLILVFVAIILVLTHIFGIARAQSSGARLLTNAVRLAENGAEALSASRSEGELLALLDEAGNASLREDGAGVTAYYDTDMRPDPAGRLRLDVSWEPEGDGLVRSVVTVRLREAAEPIYGLDTAVYLKEGAA